MILQEERKKNSVATEKILCWKKSNKSFRKLKNKNRQFLNLEDTRGNQQTNKSSSFWLMKVNFQWTILRIFLKQVIETSFFLQNHWADACLFACFCRCPEIQCNSHFFTEKAMSKHVDMRHKKKVQNGGTGVMCDTCGKILRNQVELESFVYVCRSNVLRNAQLKLRNFLMSCFGCKI